MVRLSKMAVERAEGVLSNKIRLALSAWEEDHPAPVAQGLSDYAIAEIAVNDPEWKHRFLAGYRTHTGYREHVLDRNKFLVQSKRAARAELRATAAYRAWTARRDAVHKKMLAASSRLMNRAVIGGISSVELADKVEQFNAAREACGS